MYQKFRTTVTSGCPQLQPGRMLLHPSCRDAVCTVGGLVTSLFLGDWESWLFSLFISRKIISRIVLIAKYGSAVISCSRCQSFSGSSFVSGSCEVKEIVCSGSPGRLGRLAAQGNERLLTYAGVAGSQKASSFLVSFPAFQPV